MNKSKSDAALIFEYYEIDSITDEGSSKPLVVTVFLPTVIVIETVTVIEIMRHICNCNLIGPNIKSCNCNCNCNRQILK